MCVLDEVAIDRIFRVLEMDLFQFRDNECIVSMRDEDALARYRYDGGDEFWSLDGHQLRAPDSGKDRSVQEIAESPSRKLSPVSSLV